MVTHKKQQIRKSVGILLRWFALSLLFVATHALAQTGGTVTYVYTDPQGTPLAETDASGNITATFEYTPYGTYAPQGTSTPGPVPKGPGYTGHVNDPETNLVYMQARYYDSVTGRFLSIDPNGPAPGVVEYFNRYSYVGDNPISRVDPFGEYFCKSDGGCENFKKAYKKLKDAARSYARKSTQGKAFDAVIAYYGDEDSTNSSGQTVNIKEEETSTGDPGEIGHNWLTGADTITFNVNYINSLGGDSALELAASIAHEGEHGVDDAIRRKAGKKQSPDTVLATERSAYRLQSYVYQAFNYNSPYALWRSNWAASDVESKRDSEVDFYAHKSLEIWLHPPH